MSTSEMPHIDLECGCWSSANIGYATSEEEGEKEEERSVHFSDANNSCDRSSEILEDESLESKRASSVSFPSDCSSIDTETGEIGEKRVNLARVVRNCRICHSNLVSDIKVAIELGCSCKDDLGAAHKHCAETWFKIKGDKTCEICHSIAVNVVGPVTETPCCIS